MKTSANVAAAARDFLARGFAPIPLPFQSKKPALDGWPKLRLTAADVGTAFPSGTPSNIGLLPGGPSGGLVDVDLDSVETLAAAPLLLPATSMKSGRRSTGGCSHWWYVTAEPPQKASTDFADPVRGASPDAEVRTTALLLELRSTGGQTVVPPSVYPAEPEKGRAEAEPCVWWRGQMGEPARAGIADLRAAVGAVAAAALLGRYWPKSRRHACALALAGGLLRQNWSVERVEVFVRAVCAAACDEEPDDRVRSVHDTAESLKRGEPATGFPNLIRELGAHGPLVLNAVSEWLGLERKTRAGDPKVVFGQGYEASRAAPERYVPIPDYVPFPTDCLPAPWDAFVREGAAALRCDEVLVALPLLAVLAGAVGNTRRVHLGAEWFEPCIFWTCPVAESGGMKTGAANLSVDLVRARQKRLMKVFKEEMKEYKKLLKGFKASDGEGDEPEKPTLERVLVGDITIEKLATLHDDNRRGLLVARDELAGWFGSFTKYKGKGGGTDEPNWLSMHRGDAIVYDRKTGDKTSVFVPHAATSITGGIQPGVLRRLASHSLFESGMVARIIFAMPPRTPKTWSDDEISPATKDAAARNLEALYALRGTEDEDGDECPVVVKLGREARARLKRFVNEWGVRQFEAEGERAAVLSKLEALPGRFALLRHLVLTAGTLDDTQPIGLDDLEAGIRLAEWCARETERVYATLAQSEAETDTRKLVELVTRIAAKNDGKVTTKLLQRANCRKYTTSELAKADLERLVALGLGVWELGPDRPGGGHRPEYFILHTRPCMTHDSSYPRDDEDDDDGGAGVHDRRPEGPDVGPGTQDDSPRESPDPETSCDVGSGDAPEQGYEESCVMHDREPANGAAGGAGVGGASDGARVMHPPTVTTTSLGVANLVEVLAELPDGAMVGLDTETTGLDPTRDRVRLVQVAVGDEVAVIDLFTFSDPRAALAPLFAALQTKEVAGHNLQFDLRFLAPLGFTPGRLFDTMLASKVLHAGEREENNARPGHSLADAVDRELGRSLEKDEQTSDWSGTLTARQLSYAAADAAVLLPLAGALKEKLAAADLTATADLEMRALLGVAWAAPVTVDVPAWFALADAAASERARLAESMDAMVPNPSGLPGMQSWNWGSPAQVREALAAAGVKVKATDDDALAGVSHPLAALVREHRAASKRADTYGRGWVLEHLGAENDWVLPSWNQLGAETGRMSCSAPNLQNIPRGSDYRRCFVARPGRVLVKADYSQVELRIAAKVADEPVMIAAYQEGRDLHTLTAARVLNKPEAEVTKADRQLAKAINFGLLYGMGWKSLKGYAKSNYGVELTDRQAQNYRAAFFKTYPALAAWHTRVEARVKKLFRADPDGFHEVRTLAGRRRLLPVAKRDAAGKPYPNKTDALNTPVQGTGADGLKAAIAALWDWRDVCPTAVPVIFCHDEIVVEVDEADADRASDWLRDRMERAVAPLIDPVPIEVEVTVGRTWGGDAAPPQNRAA